MGLQTYQLLQTGGRFLGAARSWMQWNKLNGSQVTWGSRDVLQPPVTVHDIEDLAAHVAAAHEADKLDEYNSTLIRIARFLKTVAKHIPPGADESLTLRMISRDIDNLLGNYPSELDSPRVHDEP